MSNTVEFLSYLRSLDIEVAVREGRLSCNAPKGVLTPELKEQLKVRKSEIIDFLQAAGDVSPDIIIPHVKREGYLTPSFGQQRLWFLEQFDPDSTAYHISGGLRFLGELNRRALEAAFQEVIRRHEILRTSILNIDGTPKAVIRDTVEWRMGECSLTGIPHEDREQALQAMACEQARRRFDFEAAPLMRACLVVLGPTEHALLIQIHHIAADGWSLGVFAQELTQLYEAFCAGLPSPLPQLPVQYADYVEWRRRHVENGLLHSEVQYWKRQLRGPLPVTELPGDHARPPRMTFRGRRLRQRLPETLWRAIERFSLEQKVTPFTTLLAAFQLLLFRYTRQPDVIVGSATAGRSRPELEQLIGLFINNLVLRTDLSGDPTVGELLGRVRETTLDAFSHENVSLDYLVELLQPQRELNRPPLFQVMFLLQNFPLRTISMNGLTVEPLEFDPGTSRFDLTVEACEHGGELRLDWEYNTDLYEQSTIERLHSHYGQVLEGFVADTGQRISQIRMLTSGEWQRIEAAEKEARLDYPAECIHEWYARQAASTPDATAVASETGELTYRELDEHANRLANHLRKLGVGPEVLVGICLERGVNMAVALLGVLKAGGAYVPLDPQYPPERLSFMLEDSRAAVLISEPLLIGSLPSQSPAVVTLDEELLASESAIAPFSGVAPTNLAYVIYTSGSTGRPKGVEITHRSVVNFLVSMQREPGISPADRLLAVTTLCFDIAGLEFYLPLVSGATVVIAPRAAVADGTALQNLLTQSRATMMQATPVTWRLLLEAGWQGQPGMRVLCGGEALPRELANRLLATGAEVWNLYGPTETTIWSSVERIESGPGSVLIGRPVANTQFYILDDNGQPVPEGVAGELYIGGDGLARGYLRRPELTAEKFVAHPWRPDERIYRTGDLARRCSDGAFECLGRLDHQVKIRGFRIEMGEIEAALECQPGIEQAVVIVREDVPGDRRLTAYIVVRDRAAVNAKSLREQLAKRLPEYMLPSSFVILDAFPLTPNNKVDRKALPVPLAGDGCGAVYAAPRTAVESRVAAIWQELLRHPKVGVNDNFFDLGGHSLLVVQLQSRLRQQFQREISLVDLFERPTIATLAGLLHETASFAEVAPERTAARRN